MNRQLRAPEHRDPSSVFTQNLIRLLCLILLSAAASPARAAVVSWELFQSGTSNCALPAGIQIPCGDYGLFVIDPIYPTSASQQQCNADAAGQETPPGFVARKVAIHPGTLGNGVPASVSLSLTKSGSSSGLVTSATSATSATTTPPWSPNRREHQRGSFATKAAAPDLPCSLGSCFVDRTSPLRAPYIAMIDWDDWHGWTVGWTISMMANHEIPVTLYAFEDMPELQPELGITDLHLLGLACKLAEDIDHNNFDRPLVVNMSFGRPPAETDGDSPGCQYLNCQVGKVFDHLTTGAPTGTPDTVLFAAAGNHQQLLTPALDDRVLAAGSIDLSQFNSSDSLQSSWETIDLEKPEQHLMVGYPLCLNYLNQQGQERSWEAPAGTSYASAALTGWLARQQLVAPVPNLSSAALTPSWIWETSETGSLFLTHGTQKLIEYPDAARGLLARTFGKYEASCGLPRDPGNILKVYYRGTSISTGSLGKSIIEVQEQNRPTPAPDPCVPCSMIDDGGVSFKSVLAPAPSLPSPASPSPTLPQPAGSTPTDPPIYLDLSAHSDMPDRQEIVHIYLRIDDTLHDLQLTPQELNDFAIGTYTHLELHGFNQFVCAEKQPSLVYKILIEGSTEEVWSSSPIFLKGNNWPPCAPSLAVPGL